MKMAKPTIQVLNDPILDGIAQTAGAVNSALQRAPHYRAAHGINDRNSQTSIVKHIYDHLQPSLNIQAHL